MMQLIFAGGIIMIPLFICSIIALAIIVEKFFLIKKTRKEFRYNAQNLWNYINSNNITGLISAPVSSSSWLFKTMKKALAMRKKGSVFVQDILQKEGEQFVSHIQRRLGILSTIVTIAPMLGLLGTVFGMIVAFQSMQLANVAGRVISIGDLAGGIWQALITTAFGLIIAIPSLIAHNYLISVVNFISLEYEKLSNALLNLVENSKSKITSTQSHVILGRENFFEKISQ